MPSWWPKAPSPASTVENSPLATSRPPPTVVVSPPTVTLTTSADPGLSPLALRGGAPVAGGMFYPNGGTSPRVSSPPPEGNGHRGIVSPPAPISVQSRPAPPMGSHDPRRVNSPPPLAAQTRQPTPVRVIHRGPAPPTTSYVSNLPTNQKQSAQDASMPDWWPKQHVSDSRPAVSDTRPATSRQVDLPPEETPAPNPAGRGAVPQLNRHQPEPEYYDNTSPEWQARNATSSQSLSSHSPAPASSTTSGAVQIPSSAPKLPISAPKLPLPLPARPGDRDPMTSPPQVPSRPGDRPAALDRSLADTEQHVARVVAQANQGFLQSARDVASIEPTLSVPPPDLDFTHPSEEDFWNMSPRHAQMTSSGGDDVTRRLVTSEATQTEGDPLLDSDDTWSRLLEAVASGTHDEPADGSPGLRSRYTDTLRSQYRDTLRSQYRDTLRSQYGDTLRSRYRDTLRRRPDTDAAAQRPILPQGECQPHERLARQQQELESLEQQRRQQAGEEQQQRREHQVIEQDRHVDCSQRQEQVFVGKRYNERRLYEEQQVVEQRDHERRRYDEQEWLQKQEEERHWHEQERRRQQEDEQRQKQEHQRLLQKQEDERRRQQQEREEEERRLQYQQYLQREEEERRKREHEAYLKRQEEEIRRKQEEDELRMRREREEKEQIMRKQKEEEEQRLLRQKEEEEKERLEQLRRQREQEEEQRQQELQEQRQQELQEQLQRELRNQHQQQWRRTQQDQQVRRERELRQQQQQLQQERQQARQQQQQLAADWRRPAENTSPPVAGLRRNVSLRESSRAGDLARRAGRVWDEEADWLRREIEETDRPDFSPVTQQRGDSYERTRVYSEMKTAAATSRGGAHVRHNSTHNQTFAQIDMSVKRPESSISGRSEPPLYRTSPAPHSNETSRAFDSRQGHGQRRASFQQSFMSPPPGGYLPPSSPSKSDPGWCRGEDNDSGRSSPNPLDDELEICLKSVEEAMASLQNSVQKSTARPETSSATPRPELNRSFEVSPAGGGSSGDWRRRSCDGAELETFGSSRSWDRAEERDRAEGAKGAQELRPCGVLRPLQHHARHLWTAAENTSSNWTRLVIGDWLLGAPDDRHPQEVLSRQIALWEGQPETPGPDWRQRGLREPPERPQSGAQQRALGGTQQRAHGGSQERALGGPQERALGWPQDRALGGSHYRGDRDPESEEHSQVDSQISRIGRESRQKHRHITDRMLPSPPSTYSGSSGQRSDSWRSSPQTPSPWQPSAGSPPQSPPEGGWRARQSPSGSPDWNARHQPRQTSEQPAFPWQHNAPQEPPWAGHNRRANTLADHRYGSGFGRRPTLTSYQSQSATLPAAQPRPAAPWDFSERQNVHSPGSVRSSPGGPQVAAPSGHWAAPLSPSGSVSSVDWNQLFDTSSEQSSCMEDEPSSVSSDWGRPLSREEVVRWYQQTQLPRGVGVDALTGRAAAWFH
ncbi:mediator of RNA polymerase II transcription subunit 12-like, partial [Amphibalanus amphitrite]|uniref:mediator of RNA polymerase II transcription subunit 12-like n=1 Tax=Amphibalanus amphitrite TaxID=1232801 RepID=UPI001C919118